MCVCGGGGGGGGERDGGAGGVKYNQIKKCLNQFSLTWLY